MKLEELFPESPSFTLRSTGKTYHLRVPNLEDKAQINQWLSGGDGSTLHESIQKGQWGLMAKIIYRLIKEKEDFEASEEVDYDEDGFKKTVIVTGPTKLLRAAYDEGMTMMTALNDAFKLSEPAQAESAASVASGGEKKRLAKSTGVSSSISSQVSTATRQKSSGS